MPTFAFNLAPLSTLSASKTYYAQIVSAVPANTAITMADISSLLLSTAQVLTGTTYSSQTLNFADQTFNTRTYVSTHTGYVIAERIGASFSSTDPLIVYVPHANGLSQEITLPIGTYAIPIDFPSGGLFATVNAWRYQAGAYVNNAATYYNNGIIELIGTKNNTVAYANPTSGATPNIEYLVSGGTATRAANLFARTNGIAMDNTQPHAIMLRFRGGSDIMFGTGAQIGWNGSAATATRSFRLWGSNLLSQGWVSTAIDDSANWTQLVDLGITTPTIVSRLSPTFNSNSVFYKYLKIGIPAYSGSGDYFLGSIDFYNCTVRTPNQNFN